MPRKTRCYVCKKYVSEAVRFNSLQHYNHVVCSPECGHKLIEWDE